jgi:hypothetical protein
MKETEKKETEKTPEGGLEDTVRIGQAKVLSTVLSKLANKPELFHEALDASRTKNKDAFVKALTKAGISKSEIAMIWEIAVSVSHDW